MPISLVTLDKKLVRYLNDILGYSIWDVKRYQI